MRDSYLARRYEFKYDLDPLRALQVEHFLNTIGLRTDENAGEDGYYPITSLYFDTPHYDDFYAKEAGLLRRKKLRVRVYGEGAFDEPRPHYWLELKKKHDMMIMKERVALSPEEWRRFAEGDTLALLQEARGTDHKALREFMYFYLRQNYRPVAIVSYKRKPYIDQFTNTVRVTLDKEITAARVDGFCQGGSMANVAPERVVLEVKFKDVMPWWFARLVKTLQLERTTFSKYTRGVDAVRRETRRMLPR
jgi:SPX domain protein involved in polyphosphate accumulation